MINFKRKTGRAALLGILFTFTLVWSVTAEPVWSGNASVDSTEFINFVEDTPLAGASSSFTRNTVVEVTNPQNGRTINVTIVKRAPRPGVFLVLSGQAGEALGFPVDQVIPVQVRVVADKEESAYDSRFESTDPDINPAVNLPESGTAALVPPDPETAEVPSEKMDEESVAETAEDTSEEDVSELTPETDIFMDKPVPVPLPAEPEELLVLAEETPVEEEALAETVPEAAEDILSAEEVLTAEEETDTVEDIDESFEEETAPQIPVEMIPENLDEDNVIYFLTPSDFRPPVVPEEAAEEEIIPVYVERDVLEDQIATQLKNGSSYIQLGAYSSAEIVYSEMESIASRYPMIVWTDGMGDETVYKLLIGPLTSDETGVLVYRFRAGGYPDLFLYKP